MLKKNEVIEVLERGGHITINEIYRSATVYFEDCSDPVGVCRFDTAERLEKSAEYITERGEAWSFTRRIYKAPAHYWDELSARVMAAVSDSFRALERAGVISDLEIEPISADRAAELSASLDAEEDPDEQGSEDLPEVWTPAPGHIAIRNTETEEILEGTSRAIYYALHQRFRWDRREGENGGTWEAISSSAAAVIAAAQEAAERPTTAVRKQYARADGTDGTTSAAEALSWHRAGHDIIVSTPGKNAVYIHGAPQKTAPRGGDENRAHCEHIARELDAYVDGAIRRCPDCGEEHRRDWGDVGEVFKCPNCGEISDPDDWEQLSVWDFLGDCYDIEYRVGSRQELRSVQIMVACGGPNIYLDTASKDVELYWWGERARYPMSYEAVEALDDWADEMWRCM